MRWCLVQWTLPGTTPGCVFVFLKPGDGVWFKAGLEAGLGAPRNVSLHPALLKPLLTLDLLPDHFNNFLIILKSPHWKAGGGNQDRRVEQTLL